MIIKSMARKSMSFGQLLRYLDAPEAKGPALLHNLGVVGDDGGTLEREFLMNARLLAPRKNGNVLYHEVLSFHRVDSRHLTTAVIEDLTRRYLALRAPYALAYGRAHFDTEHPHVHLMISANNFASRRRLRISKARFRTLRRELEAYRREQYPELVALPAEPESQDRLCQRRAEGERARRFGGRQADSSSGKERIRAIVLREIEAAGSGPECWQRLLRQGLRLYRRGQTVGVEATTTGRRYRLETLGLAAAFERSFAAWRELPALPRFRALRGREPPDAPRPER
jgi:hypothetical protein